MKSGGIGTLTETSLHAGIKAWLRQPGDQFEVSLDGYVIDVVRGRQLIEIQTGNFGAIKRKLAALLAQHPVQVVYPVAAAKWIVRQTAVGRPIRRRKSPKKGQALDLFAELVRIPHLLDHPRLTITALLTHQEEIWRDDGRGSWRRRRWSIVDRRLLSVASAHTFTAVADYLQLLPPDLPQPFTNRDLADAASIRLRLAQRVTYTLRHAGALSAAGKRQNAHLFKNEKRKM